MDYGELQPHGGGFMKTNCIFWDKRKDKDGYGRVTFGNKHGALAHRIEYIKKHGEIPKGLTIDHLCRNRS